MVVAILGILKAGAAYVPLDPHSPKERLMQIWEDCQLPWLLTTEDLRDNFTENYTSLICLDSHCSEIEQYSPDNLSSTVTAENLAYVIYTSGSTGKPKGVMIGHQSLVNAYAGWEQAYNLTTRTSSHLQMANFVFDVFTGDLVRALGSGSKLVLCPREWLLIPEKLYQLLQQQAVDCAEFVPAVLRPLMEYLETTQQSLDFMKVLIVGSDSWLVQEYQKLSRLSGRETYLVNSYGVTEACIDSCYFAGTDWDLSEEALVPIGRPFANTNLYVLDDNLQLVPLGIPGELHIEGVGLAKGYFNASELTALKFIPNPFRDNPQSRLYKTGDLVRYLPDGNLEYLGRIDNQVKIRGFRIELGEIEAALIEHIAVQETVVIGREDIPGDKRLVAYLVIQGPVNPSLGQLREFLQQKLPEYMLPSAFVFLEALPLNSNGKIDRKNLPLPGENSFVTNANFAPPLDVIEHQLSEIWSEILNIYPVGVKDNFFELGGHSLLAVQLMGRIQQQFQTNLPLSILFQNSTIQELATVLRQPINDLVWSPLVAIKATGSKRPFFCVPGAGGNPIYFYKLAHYLGADQPFYALQSLGLDGESEPYTRVEDMATYYIEAIQSIQPEGPYALGGHSFGGIVAFEMAQQLNKLGHKVDVLALLDAGAPELEIAEDDIHSNDADWLYEIGVILENLYATSLEISAEILKSLDSEEQLYYFKERLQAANLLSPGLGINQLRGLLKVYKTEMQIVYQPGEIYSNQIICFASSQIDESGENPQNLDNPFLKWQPFSAKSLNIHWIPGNHWTMLDEPNVQILAAELTNYLQHK
jgi:amino acid adenylation domain-containing protein